MSSYREQQKEDLKTQEECLIELFNKNVPVSEIAVTLMRTESGIRARLKKLGLIEKRSEI